MGNKLESRNKSISEVFGLSSFSQKDQKKDEIYGDMLLLQDAEGPSAMKQKTVTDEMKINRLRQWQSIMLRDKCPNLIRLLKYHDMNDENLCATSFVIYSRWEYLENNLASEIQLRSCSGHLFREHEVFTLIQEVVTGMEFLQSNNKPHRQLSSSNILIDSAGVYKLVDPNFFEVVPNLA